MNNLEDFVKVAGFEKIKQMDFADHLNCEKKGLIAHLYSIDAPVDFLFYASLESSEAIINSCYNENKFRWNYRGNYLNESEWSMIGLRAGRTDEKFNFCRFIELLKMELDAGRPIFFYASKGKIPFYVEILKSLNSPMQEYFDEHCFFICGYSGKTEEILFYDVLHGQGILRTSSISDMEISFATSEYISLNDVYAVWVDKIDINHEHIWHLHTRFLSNYSDDLKVYDFIIHMMDSEIMISKPTHHVASVNAISIVYGSRLFFSRFLTKIGYGTEVIKCFDQLVEALSRVQKYINVLFARLEQGKLGIDSAFYKKIKDALQDIKMMEQNAMIKIRIASQTEIYHQDQTQ